MIRCLLGERKSGKSVFIEKRVIKTDNKALYIATLPALKMYEEVISRHQERRPASWECIELFKMSADEMLAYPYHTFQNVILDNLTYYVLFQLYYRKDDFVRECDGRFFSLIDAIAADSYITCHLIDTPIEQSVLSKEDETGIIRSLFSHILDQAAVVERFYSEDMIFRMKMEEGKDYFFRT